MNRILTIATLLAALVAARDAAAIGEQNGRIKGTITEPQSGVGLPGVTVTARSPALIGGPRTVGTTDDGRYEIVNLPPGLYTVEISYAGAAPLVRQVVVRQGETAPLNVAWTPEETGVQTVTVSEPRPITRPDSAEVGGALTADTLNRIPTDRSYQGVAQFLPGVTGVDNGGNPNIRGGLEIQNRFLIDGLDITDPVTGTFSANLTFDAIGSVQVLTGGMEAQYNSMGGVINVITNGGSDEFTANASLYVNHQKLTASAPYGAQLYNGRQEFNDVPVGPTKSYQANLNIGGPILRKRLWYSATFEFDYTSNSNLPGPPLGVPPYNIVHPPRTYLGEVLRLKLTWAPSANHRISLSTNSDPAVIDNVSGAEKNSLLGVAEDRQKQGGLFSIVSWDWYLTPNLNTNLQAGFQVNTIEYGPMGRLGSIDFSGCDKFMPALNCMYDPNRAQHTNLVDNTVWYQGGAYDKDARYTVQIDPSISLRKRWFGFHDAKAGIQTRINYRTEHNETPGGAQYLDQGDAALPLEAGLCDPKVGDNCYRRIDYPSYDVKEKAYSVGFYVQDRWWTPLSWLTVAPGLRLDYGHTEDRNGKTVSNLFGIGPRLALVGDLTRDGKNVVSLAYGRSTEVLSLLPAAYFDGAEAAVTVTKQWDPAKHDFTREITRSGGAGGVVIDKNLTTPHSDEIILDARRLVFTSTALGVTYTWKRVTNYWDQVEINQIWDPSGARVVGYVDPTKMGQTVFNYTTPDANHRTYQGFDLYVQGRPSTNWDVTGSYTLSWLYGPGQTEFQQITNFSQFASPRRFRFFDGFLLEDARHSLKGFAAYRLGRLNIGTAVLYQSGNPRTKRFFTAQDGDYTRYRSPLGTEPGKGNDIKEISELRLPDRFTINLRLTLNLLPEATNQRLSLIADIFNVLNNQAADRLTTTDIDRFGQAASRQNPLQVQVAINYVY